MSKAPGEEGKDRKTFSSALTSLQAFPVILTSGFLQLTSHSTPQPPLTPDLTHKKSFPVQTTRGTGSETTNVSCRFKDKEIPTKTAPSKSQRAKDTAYALWH